MSTSVTPWLRVRSIIETPPNYCGSPDSEDFPLVMVRPAISITNKWDTTGQLPTGPGASGMFGQTTTCYTGSKEIGVSIDRNTTERPNLVSDLNFHPLCDWVPEPGNHFFLLYCCPGDRQGRFALGNNQGSRVIWLLCSPVPFSVWTLQSR